MSGKRTVTFDVKAKKFLIEAQEGDVELHADKKLVLECEDLEIKTSKTAKADIGTTFDLNISQKGGIKAGPRLDIKANRVELNPSGGVSAAGGGRGGAAAGAGAGGPAGAGGGGAGAGGAAAGGAESEAGAAAGPRPSATVPTHDVTTPAAGGAATGVAAGGAAGAAGPAGAGGAASGAPAGGTAAGTGGAAPAGGAAQAGSAAAGGGAAASTEGSSGSTSSGAAAAGARPAPTKKPAIVSFTARQQAEAGEKADEFESEISVVDDTDVVFKYEVADADVVTLAREGRELGQFK